MKKLLMIVLVASFSYGDACDIALKNFLFAQKNLANALTLQLESMKLGSPDVEERIADSMYYRQKVRSAITLGLYYCRDDKATSKLLFKMQKRFSK